MTSIETDDSSVREKEEKRRRRKKVIDEDERDEIKEEVVFDLPSGQRIRATTTLELKRIAGKKSRDGLMDDLDDDYEKDGKYATLPKISKERRQQELEQRIYSQCTHRLHRRQSLKPIPQIDLKNVKPKVDTKTPETFNLIRKSPSFYGKTTMSFQPTDNRLELNRLAHELSRSSKK